MNGLPQRRGESPLFETSVESVVDRLALALNSRELDLFLPESLRSQLPALARETATLNLAERRAGEYQAALADLNPDVLITSWSSPPLPPQLPTRLKYVCHMGGSVKGLVSRRHLENGLLLTDWGTSISRTVAEHALLLALAALRRTGLWLPAIKCRNAWSQSPEDAVGNGGQFRVFETASLFERRVGIHGFGRIARELIRLLQPFQTELFVCAPEADPGLYNAHLAHRVATLEELFAQCDVIFELAPLVPATTGLVTEELLRRIRPGAAFINVGRGALIDETALLRVAREGQVLFGLDVFCEEPLSVDSELRVLPNVVLSPHIGGPTDDRCRDAGAHALRNLMRYARGQPLESVVSAAIFDATT